MTPPKCCGEVIRNSANGKDFWYCRGCKKEVKEPPGQYWGEGPTLKSWDPEHHVAEWTYTFVGESLDIDYKYDQDFVDEFDDEEFEDCDD